MGLYTTPDGLVSMSCDACGALAVGDGVPLVFATVPEATIVAERDAWMTPGKSSVVCPRCRTQAAVEMTEAVQADARTMD